MKKYAFLMLCLALTAMVIGCKTHTYYPETSESISEGVVVSEETVVQ